MNTVIWLNIRTEKRFVRKGKLTKLVSLLLAPFAVANVAGKDAIGKTVFAGTTNGIRHRNLQATWLSLNIRSLQYAKQK